MSDLNRCSFCHEPRDLLKEILVQSRVDLDTKICESCLRDANALVAAAYNQMNKTTIKKEPSAWNPKPL